MQVKGRIHRSLLPDDLLRYFRRSGCGCYICNTVEFFRAVRRVLRPDGVLALNIGDSMAGGKCGGGSPVDCRTDGRPTRESDKVRGREATQERPSANGLKPGDMCGIPWAVAFALRADGWYLRSAIVWAKGLSHCPTYSGSVMPESVGAVRWERHRIKIGTRHTGQIPAGWRGDSNPDRNERRDPAEGIAAMGDCPGCAKCAGTGGYVLRRGRWRPTNAYEFIFLLTPSERYHANAEAVREASAPEQVAHNNRYAKEYQAHSDGASFRVPGMANSAGIHARPSPDGSRNLRNVWWLPLGDDPEDVFPLGDLLVMGPEPLADAHYAAFPRRLPREFIRIFVPKKCCPTCGAPWAAVVAHSNIGGEKRTGPKSDGVGKSAGTLGSTAPHGERSPVDNILGHLPTCDCYAEVLARVSRATADAERFVHGELGTTIEGDGKALAWMHQAEKRCAEALPPVPGTVLDPCGGSGTTTLAAIDEGVASITCEASEHYAETILKPRVRNHCGEGKLPTKPLPADLPLFQEAE